MSEIESKSIHDSNPNPNDEFYFPTPDEWDLHKVGLDRKTNATHSISSIPAPNYESSQSQSPSPSPYPMSRTTTTNFEYEPISIPIQLDETFYDSYFQ